MESRTSGIPGVEGRCHPVAVEFLLGWHLGLRKTAVAAGAIQPRRRFYPLKASGNQKSLDRILSTKDFATTLFGEHS